MDSNSTFIYPYRSASASAAGIANALGIRRISHTNSRFVGRPNKTVINWGATEVPDTVMNCGRVLNPPDRVRQASNKRVFFEAVQAAGEAGPRIPAWTTSMETAQAWLANGECTTVFGRRTLSGHSGEGIEVFTQADQVVNCPLYTQYVKKREEYRVHVSTRGVFSIQRKARQVSAENANYMIRNLANGFIFARDNVQLPNQDATDQAVKALAVSGLDFGAVDIIYNERSGLSYVLEINTAPGLEGTTVLHYETEIRGLLT
jgi:glutathione synthase/RimK-type ligase-like ATP-grasp enzyme